MPNEVIQPAAQTHYQVKLNLGPFTPTNPSLWFMSAEILFDSNQVTTEDAKFSHLIQHLGADQRERISTVMKRYSQKDTAGARLETSPYTAAKAALLQEYNDTEEQRYQKLLNGTHIPADSKPSTVLQKLRDLAGTNLSPDMEALLKQIWLNKICQQTRLMITPSIKIEIGELSMQADNVWTLLNNTRSLPPAPATSVSAPATVAAVSDTQMLFQKTMLEAIAGLTAQVAALSTSHPSDRRPSRHDSRSPPQHRRSSSHYRKYRSPSPYRSQNLFNGVCWYHHTFGDNAINCVPECSRAKAAGNDAGGHQK